MNKCYISFVLLLISASLIAQFPEDFESGTFPPQDWILLDNGVDIDNVWQPVTFNFNSPTTSAYMDWAPYGGGVAEDWLVTSQFTPQPDESTLSYYEYHSFTTFISNYSIRVSSASQDNQADFEIVEAYSTTDFGPTNLWLQHFVDLSAYEGIPIYIAFVMANEDGDDWYIDDVDIGPEPGCLDPILLGINNLTAIGADISFLETGVANLWEFEIIEGGTAATGIANAVSDGMNPFTWDGGVTNTNYDVYMRSDCGADGFSNWVGPLNFTTLPPPPPNDDCATAIPLTVGGPASCNPTVGYNSGATDSGYQHPCAFYNGGDVWYSFVATNDSIWVETSMAPNGFFDGGLAVYEGTDCDSLMLIDCDDDGGNGLFSLIKLENLTVGETYYVAVWEFGNDQIGDFNVCVYEPPTCLMVDFFFAFTDSVAADFALVNWETLNPGGEFLIEYGPAGFIPGTGTVISGVIGIDGPPAGIDGLESSTAYEFYVQEVCAPGDSTILQGPFFIFTLESCPQAFPWLFEQEFTSLDSISLDWQSFNDSAMFVFEYGPPGFLPGTGTIITGTIGVDAPPLGIGGLTEDTFYDYYLTEICAPGDTAFPVFGIMETLAPPPPNNDLCDAIELVINDPVEFYTNAGGSLTGGAPLGTCWFGEYDLIDIETVWFYFVANMSGEATVTTDFPNTELHDTHIAVYELPSGDCNEAFNIVEIGCDEDSGIEPPNGFTSIVNLTGLTPDMPYYIQVDGYGSQDGEFGIQVLAEPDPSSVLELDGFGDVINMFPNPTNDRITLSTTQNFGNANLELIDIMGKKVFTQNIALLAAQDQVVDISSITPGNYLIRVITDNKVLISRLIIQ